MKQICIFDILGSYCGMHYYDIAFAEAFRERGYKTMIYSNFKEKKEDCCFFSSFFTCCKFIGCFRILYAYLKFLFFVFFHYNYKIIYLAYGELYEVPFLIIASCGKHVFVDVHEVYALKYKDTSFTSKLFKWLYRSRIHNVIYHSQRTYDLLNNDRLKMLYVPHFRYVFQKSCQIENVSQEILDCFKCSSPRYLFFGNLTTVKGVDVVCEAFEHLKKLNVNYELVIAGKNVYHRLSGFIHNRTGNHLSGRLIDRFTGCFRLINNNMPILDLILQCLIFQYLIQDHSNRLLMNLDRYPLLQIDFITL